ncbi:hypothetical protein NE237_026091 [Protea cynaroides]|uniref:Aminotransferase class I/classII large domain-containing protein n=1 Tax=Protea cynaroides TaxID=273540 RepID=A0A9Q0H4A1_9MAGN|nr:hypothetical protein NE237_026091 [Protea cynaroides]
MRDGCIRWDPIRGREVSPRQSLSPYRERELRSLSVYLHMRIAEYLSKDLPYKLSPDNVFVTNASSNLEVRHFDLLPERGWEADLEAVEAIADENTVALVIVNPGNPCGNVCSYQHLEKVAKTAKKLGIMVISDEVFSHLIFGSKPFVPMGVFGSTVPVLTLGSLSKRWLVPGWRLGWFVVNDPTGILKETKVFDSIKGCLHAFSDPSTFVQGAIPYILQKTEEDFFRDIISVLKQNSKVCYNKINEMQCITYPHKSEGSPYAMLN